LDPSSSKGKGGRVNQLAGNVEIRVFLPDSKDYFLFRDDDILGKWVD
jgi:hypothetical protein